jgi:hypothetical protein
MTHDRAAWTKAGSGGDEPEIGLDDVEIPSGYFGLHLVPAVAYGWDKTKTLAKQSKAMGTPNSPDNNADSLALFGSSKCTTIVNPLAYANSWRKSAS